MEQDNHIVIDLETHGTKVNAPIIAIGAVRFNPSTGQITGEFYQNIDWKSALAVEGVEADPKTITWWQQQDPAAKENLMQNQIDINSALDNFTAWLPEEPIVWGNGATFDIGILEFHYWGEEKWFFKNVRDMRTIEHLGRALLNYSIKQHPFFGIRHSALDDSINQATYISMVWKALAGSVHMDIESKQ